MTHGGVGALDKATRLKEEREMISGERKHLEDQLVGAESAPPR